MITKDIARALMAGPKTVGALAEELDLTVEEVWWACTSMRKCSKVHSRKPFFMLTDKGREWVDYFDSGRGYVYRSESQRLRRLREAAAKGAPLKEVPPPVIVPPSASEIVQRAQAARHPLHMAWGAVNA